jgi:hypothetical protein
MNAPQRIQLEIQNFPAQEAIFNLNKTVRYVIVPKGRRFGLTKGAANNFIEEALAREFYKGLWVDTINANIDRYIERYFMPHLKKLPAGWWKWRKKENIVMIRDSYIDFRSADNPENIEGFGYDKFFINEAGIVLKNEYLWHNAISPMLLDYSARGVIGGTPKGKGLFFQLANYGDDPNKKLYKTLRYTSFDNPLIKREDLQDFLEDKPERVIAQEIYANFLDDTGTVFRGVQAITKSTPQEPINGHVYVMGVDLAKVTDFTVITVYDRANNCQVYQDRFNKLDYTFQKAKIRAISKHYNNALVMLDAASMGDPIADDLTRVGVPLEPIKLTNTLKKEMIEKLIIWIEQRRLLMLPLDETIKEFTNFTYDISATGKTRYNAPEGLHDDIVISHALAVWSLNPMYREVKQREDTLIETMLKQAQYGKRNEQYDEYDPGGLDTEPADIN